jgi:toxin CcdB
VARFDVYRNVGPHAASTPYLLEVQCDLLDELETSVVIPLRRVDRSAAVALPMRLIPLFQIEGRDCLLETPKLAAVPRRLLKDHVASLANDQSAITGALDFLFQGY